MQISVFSEGLSDPCENIVQTPKESQPTVKNHWSIEERVQGDNIRHILQPWVANRNLKRVS